jgi:hypothetical protein
MNELINIFKTRIKSLEIMLLLKGIKPAVRQIFYPHEINEVKKFCRGNSLFIVESEFKVKLADASNEFSNKGIATKKEDSSCVSFYYISHDELLAYKASLYEIKKDHKNLGKILGYPDCCIDFFIAHSKERERLDNDYEIPVLNNSKGNKFSFYNNIFQRKNDYSLLSHFPCSLSCKESSEIGKRHFETLYSSYPKISEEFKKNLSGEFKSISRIVRFI